MPSSPATDVVVLSQLAYSPAEAADLIGVSRAHLYNLMNRGELRTVKVGRCRRVPRDEIARLVGLLPEAGAE